MSNKKVSDLPLIEANLDYGTTVISTLVATGTWYPLISSNISAVRSVGFTSTDGEMTYTDTISRIMKFIGSAAFSTDKACQLEFGLFVNDTLVDTIYSIEDVLAVDKKGGFSENGTIQLAQNDVVDIRAKTNNANTEITVSVLSLLLFYI